jgi:sugar lactone lactonase YvrE
VGAAGPNATAAPEVAGSADQVVTTRSGQSEAARAEAATDDENAENVGVDHGGGQTLTPADAERLNAAAGLASLAFAKVSYLRVFARSTARWVEVDDNGNANAASGHQSVLGNAALGFFEGLVTDTAGNVYAVALEDKSLAFAGIIYKFAPDGTRTVFGTTPGQTFGLAFDGAGNLYAADAFDVTIYKFAPDGTRTVFAGPSAFTSPQVPAGLVFDASGNLFVSTLSNRPNDAILLFTPTGMESTFATGLSNPHGLAFDAAGNLFVAETLRDGAGDILEFTTGGPKIVFASELNRPEYLTFGPPR